MSTWSEVLSQNHFLGAPSELRRCTRCGYRTHYLAGQTPTACPVCSKALTSRPCEVDCTPELVDATIPDGAMTAGVARVA